MFSHIKELFTTPSGYTIAKSVRLRSSANANLTRTPASATNRKTWTWSAWVKRGTLSTYQTVFQASDGSGNNETTIDFADTDNAIIFYSYIGAYQLQLRTTQAFRDPSAWYHIVAVLDTTQATPSNRAKLYINGVQVTAFSLSTYPSQNYDGYVNYTQTHYFGKNAQVGRYFDGYLTEINFIDGQALTPSSFGETDSITGVWKAKKYSGTYGTNGFYLNFSDNSSNTATTIGKDYSGNGNNWTPNNISVTAGATYDSMVDSPTVSAVSSNYCVLNPLQVTAASIGSPTDGNLSWSCGASASYGKIYGTMAIPSTGKYYWEVTVGSTTGLEVGIISASDQSNNYPGYSPNGYTYYIDGTKGNNNVYTSYGASFTTGNVIGVAYDAGAGTLVFYKNNTSQGTAFSGLTGTYVATLGNASSSVSASAKINFGQQPFTYTPPTGFVALNTWNLPDSTIKNGGLYMNAVLRTGTGSSGGSVTSLLFQPDLIWDKPRSNAGDHVLTDSVRGTASQLHTNTTGAQDTSSQFITAFNSNGYTIGTSDWTAGWTLVDWCWKAGGTSSSNTNGSITSTVSVGATQGFSVATFTAPSSNQSFTVGHGLGVAPQMTMLKRRDSSTGGDWWTWHIGLGDNTSTYLALNQTAASTTAANMWGTVGRNSTVCGFNNPTSTIVNATYVMYNFAAVKGFSAFGSYTGNGSTDGPFVFTGFQPRWIMVKQSSAAGEDWLIQDTSRKPYNTSTTGTSLAADTSGAEVNSSAQLWDVLSNGFKLRATGGGINTSGATYIYAAFASNPFSKSLAF